jgi:hypothetical protein
MNSYMGMNNFIWFHGIVEDTDDPLMIGRCRVRVIGLHDNNRSMLPTDKLPWASPMMPITSASIGGIGISPTGIMLGSWVVGFFRDGESAQDPIMMGTIPGIPSGPDEDELDYGDPTEVYPYKEETSQYNSVLNESDVNRLARSVVDDTIVTNKKSSVINNSLFSEPPTKYAPTYPDNKVLSTDSGHHQEFDDTPGAERIHTYHKSGSFEEYHPNGDRVTKIVGNDYEIVYGDKNLHVSGNLNIYVNGSVKIKVNGSWDAKVGGSHTTNSGGNMKKTAPKINLN